jgi:VanZ family protein
VVDVPHFIEHFVIFMLLGLTFALGYSMPYLLQLIPLVLFAAAIEIAQLWAPGRHARLSDFVVDALAVGIGLGIIRSMRPKRIAGKALGSQGELRLNQRRPYASSRRTMSSSPK